MDPFSTVVVVSGPSGTRSAAWSSSRRANAVEIHDRSPDSTTICTIPYFATVTYDELRELHYITPIENLTSILERGILSHRRVERIPHESIAHDAVQQRRSTVKVPQGRPLHDYVNLYFHARNPMMYVRKEQHEKLCVLSVEREIVTEDGVVITDRNASSHYVRFDSGREGLKVVDRTRVFAKYWTHNDPIEQWRRKSIKCAEVLVPDRVAPRFIRGVYVSCEAAETRVHDCAPQLTTKVSPTLFFRS